MSETVITANTADATAETARLRAGVAYGMTAYFWWGLVPIYFKQIAHINAVEVLAHRVVWAVLLLAVLMRLYGKWGIALRAMRSRKTVVTLVFSTAMIATNWYLFIWAVATDQVVEASLGYFINPLVNIVLGFVFLHERLRPWQWLSVALAASGVTYMTVSYGHVPYIALTLAGSFGCYGLLRKIVRVDALVGLTAETTMLLPLAIAYLVYLGVNDRLAFGTMSRGTDVLLSMGGVMTAVPLLCFTNAARRLRLTTLGFLQYLAPSLQLLLAVAVYGEAFTPTHLVAFGMIWGALAIYSADTIAASRRSG